MGKKDKKKKKPFYNAVHPASNGLNAYCREIKYLLPDLENIYEELHKFYLSKPKNSYHYLGFDDILEFIREKNPNVDERLLHQVGSHIFGFAATLSWKQFKQIYKFEEALLDSLWNIDFNQDKYCLLQREYIERLPCKSFYVEMPIELNDIQYDGFYFYIDRDVVGTTEEKNLMYIFFMKDPADNSNPDKNIILDSFMIRLWYEKSDMKLYNSDTDELVNATPESREILKALNPRTYEQLGDKEATKLIIKLNQMIMYLITDNLDMMLSKKAERKTDLNRVRITAKESEIWRVGEGFTHICGDMYETNYVNTDEKGVYSKTEISDNKVISPFIQERRRIHPHNRPHLRRGHFATYWLGKRDGSEERQAVIKWIEPLFINKTGEEIELPTREIKRYRFEDLE